MKLIANIIRAIIAIYLVLLGACYAALYVKENVYDEVFPTIFNYTYIVYDNDTLEPDIKKDSLVILSNDHHHIDKGDIVVYQTNTNYILKKVVEKDNYLLTVSNKNDETETINSDILLGKAVSYNNIWCQILLILINPITIVILATVGLIFPELLFNK